MSGHLLPTELDFQKSLCDFFFFFYFLFDFEALARGGSYRREFLHLKTFS